MTRALEDVAGQDEAYAAQMSAIRDEVATWDPLSSLQQAQLAAVLNAAREKRAEGNDSAA